MSARSIRRAAERKANQLARSAKPLPAPAISSVPEFPALSPAQLIANQANAQLSTGPRTPDGKAKASLNAVRSGLTGRTVLLPTDDAVEYAALIAAFEKEFAPATWVESELVQSLADTNWRLHRIRALEFALYAQGHLQFEEALNHYPEDLRHAMIQLQTHITYEKQFRNFNIQEARLLRRREKDLAELRRVQAERQASQAESELLVLPRAQPPLQPGHHCIPRLQEMGSNFQPPVPSPSDGHSATDTDPLTAFGALTSL